MANIAARCLHLYATMRPEPDIVPLAAQPIDEGLIADHRTNVIRLATLIRTGVTSASVMLERVGFCRRANDLALALGKIGRVERMMFTFDWIDGLGSFPVSGCAMAPKVEVFSPRMTVKQGVSLPATPLCSDFSRFHSH